MILPIAVVLALCCQVGRANQSRGKVATRYQHLVDLVFDDHLLFSTSSRSALHCATLCLRTSGCLTFTYAGNSSLPTSCRGHTSVMTLDNTKQSSPGANSYSFSPWLNDPCTSDSDCPAENSECFAGKCLCTPGFYFSLSRHTCLAVCAAADLRPEFVYYPNSRIRLNNLYEDSRPLDDCKLLCLGTYAGQCRTIDYRFSDGGCILAQVTALDLPSKWDVGVWDHDHYQITCA